MSNHVIKLSLSLQVNFLEDCLRPEDNDKAGDTSTRSRGVRKPVTTFKGPFLDVRYRPSSDITMLLVGVVVGVCDCHIAYGISI